MKSYCIIIVLFLIGKTLVRAQLSSDIEAYISEYKQIALSQEEQYGIPASVILAQGILESSAGKSQLARNANNHFGIKGYGGWSGPVYLAWDDESRKSRFRSYPSAEASYKDHSLFLRANSRYSRLFSISVYDYRSWAIGLQQAGYATSLNYAKALIGYIDAYKLYALNGGVKLRAGKTVTITRQVTSVQPVFDTECVMDESEESEEESEVSRIVSRFVVEINGVRCTIIYPGETIASISQKYDIPQAEILEYNEVSDSKSFKEGDIVYLGKKKKKYNGIQDYYTVKSADTLYDISQQFGIRMASLAKMNGIDIFTKLHEGDKITLQ